jgi:hypothetical protein
MKIGQYKLGRYHAIIENEWEDNSFTYETQFSSAADLQESVSAIRHCIVEKLQCSQIGKDKTMKILSMRVYRGKEAIEKLQSLV